MSPSWTWFVANLVAKWIFRSHFGLKFKTLYKETVTVFMHILKEKIILILEVSLDCSSEAKYGNYRPAKYEVAKNPNVEKRKSRKWRNNCRIATSELKESCCWRYFKSIAGIFWDTRGHKYLQFLHFWATFAPFRNANCLYSVQKMCIATAEHICILHIYVQNICIHYSVGDHFTNTKPLKWNNNSAASERSS